MDFEKICMMFMMKEPYYGIILSSMERLPTDKIKTLAVGKSGNVFQLMYNTKFTDTLSIEETLVCIKHELLHLAFNHFTLFETEPKSSQEQMLRNIAADMEVNCYVDQTIAHKLAFCLPENKGWDKMLGTLTYYKMLLEEQKKKEEEKKAQTKPEQQSQQQPQNQPDSSSLENNDDENTEDVKESKNRNTATSSTSDSNHSETLEEQTFDDHSYWPKSTSEEETELLKQTIEEILVYAAEETEKSCNPIPQELTNIVKIIRDKKKPKAVADWKRFFRRNLGNSFSEMIRKSKMRQSKRFPDSAGNRHQRKAHILVGIDTSGSISMPEYNEFFNQIKTLSSTATFHVVECDSAIRYEYDFTGIVPQTVHGHGGTNFQPVIDYFNKNYKQYESLVYFTDGCASIPKDTPKSTLWVISSQGDKDRRKYTKNGASVVFIPSKN